MNIRKTIAALCTSALLAVGLVSVTATAAPAHTPSVTTTCEALTVNLSQYAAEVPGKDATYKTVYTKYEWNGGKTETAPGFPHALWNKTNGGASYKDEPLNQAILKSNGNSDNASWVYWTSEQVIDKAAVPTKTNTVVIDGVTVENTNFGTSFSKVYGLDRSVAHNWVVVVDAHDGSAWDKTISGTTTPCVSALPADKGITCDTAWFQPGAALKNGDHINIDVVINGQKVQRNVYVDQNIQGGYNTLGLRFSDGSTKPLTENEVKTGRIDFPFGNLIDAEHYVIEWAQFNSTYFNQDLDPSKFIECGEPPVVVPEPQVCTGIGVWYTETDDAAPVVVENGLLFRGTGSNAVGIRHTADGNLQGFTGASFNATIEPGTDFYFRIVVDLSDDDGPAYRSLSFPGLTSIDADSVPYQYPGKTIADLASEFPNNKIKSMGFQISSGQPESAVAILHSYTSDCGEINFVPEKPEPREPVVVVTYGEWSGAEVTCDAPEAEWTRTVTTSTTTFTPVFENGVWVVEENTTHEDSSESKIVTLDESVVCEEPEVPVDSEEPAPVVTTPDTPKLAESGLNRGAVLTTLAGAVFLLLAGAVVLVVRAKIKAKRMNG